MASKSELTWDLVETRLLAVAAFLSMISLVSSGLSTAFKECSSFARSYSRKQASKPVSRRYSEDEDTEGDEEGAEGLVGGTDAVT